MATVVHRDGHTLATYIYDGHTGMWLALDDLLLGLPGYSGLFSDERVTYRKRIFNDNLAPRANEQCSLGLYRRLLK